jgi:hypothetical protein
MTSERHDTHFRDLHADPAENAGDRTPGPPSGLSWRRLGRFIAATVLASFVFNEIWEMAQMSAYLETAGHSWAGTLGLCTRAAVGDVGIVLGIYLTGALAAGDPGWGLRVRCRIVCATAALVGLVYAVLVEDHGLATGSWSYSQRMPLVPLLGVGLWPLLQMTLLPPLAFSLARWWASRGSG